MKISLISFDLEIFCFGIRMLSACLKEKGYAVNCIFLPLRDEKKDKLHNFKTRYCEKILADIKELCKDSDLIGMSLMTNQFMQAVKVTEYLKNNRVQAPIIWGGIEPTVEPLDCLKYADIVCLGEGEEALLELAERIAGGRPYFDTKNMWFRVKDDIIRNPVRPLVDDLDNLPLPDYSGEGHYIAWEGRLETFTKERLSGFQGERFRSRDNRIKYPMMTSRGCPFSCTYCCNSVYERLYGKVKRLRFRSVEHVIRELDMIREKVAPVDFVYFVDDNFTARSPEELKKFCEQFKKRGGVPFFCQVSPLTINEEKMGILMANGCAKVTMGVETGTERISNMYNRGHFFKVHEKAISLIEGYRDRMKAPPSYQFIIDNPYETVGEMVETLKLALKLRKPWNNSIYSLMLFPGTVLYEKGLADGLIKDMRSHVYERNWHDHSLPFFQFWIRLYKLNAPRIILRFMLLPWVVNSFTKGRR